MRKNYRVTKIEKCEEQRSSMEIQEPLPFCWLWSVKNPKFNISVVIDHGGSGSSKAAPIARKVMQKIFNKYYFEKKCLAHFKIILRLKL